MLLSGEESTNLANTGIRFNPAEGEMFLFILRPEAEPARIVIKLKLFFFFFLSKKQQHLWKNAL